MLGTNTPIDDYREGHKDRGDQYDQYLATDPFDAYMTQWESARVGSLLASHFPQGVDRYLDFACGTGRMTRFIAPSARETVGVDISDSMLKIAREKLPAAKFHCADLTTQPLDIGLFDLVSSFRFFGNADHSLREAVLKALAARVRPGGHLLVNNHRNPQALLSIADRFGARKMQVDLTPAKFRGILGRAGFEVVKTVPIGAWLFRGALAARAGSRPEFEQKMERLFSAGAWSSIAPDMVILLKKTGPSS